MMGGQTVGGWTVCGWGTGEWWVTPGSGDKRTVGGGGVVTAVARGGAGAGAGSRQVRGGGRVRGEDICMYVLTSTSPSPS